MAGIGFAFNFGHDFEIAEIAINIQVLYDAESVRDEKETLRAAAQTVRRPGGACGSRGPTATMAMRTLWTVAPVARVLGRGGSASASTSARGGEDRAGRDGTADEDPSAVEAGAPRVGRVDAWRELGFSSAREMREHHGSDFLRHNRRRLRGGRAPVTEAEFEAIVARTNRDEGSDLSSISGSDDSDSEDDSDDDGFSEASRGASTSSREDTVETRRVVRHGAGEGARLVVETEDGCTIGIWRCLAAPPGRDVDARVALETLRSLQRAVSGKTAETTATTADETRAACWVVVLARGGHFAASAFDPNAMARAGANEARDAKKKNADGDRRAYESASERASSDAVPPSAATLRKTFHRYVVRAKAGGRQSGKDGGGKTIKSAGSGLRRANEAALEKEIRALLSTDAEWRRTLREAALIFVSASKTDERTLFVGPEAPLSRDDARVRRVPFATRRPTFNETRRVVGKLALVTADAKIAVETEAETANPSAPPPTAPPTDSDVGARLAAAKARAAAAAAALSGLGMDGEDGVSSAAEASAALNAPSLSKKEKEKLKKRRAKERARAEQERAALAAKTTKTSTPEGSDGGSEAPSSDPTARGSVSGGGKGGKAAALLAKARQNQSAKRDEAVRRLDKPRNAFFSIIFFPPSGLTVARVHRIGARRGETSGVPGRSAETHRRGRGVGSLRGFRSRRRLHRGGVDLRNSRRFFFH